MLSHHDAPYLGGTTNTLRISLLLGVALCALSLSARAATAEGLLCSVISAPPVGGSGGDASSVTAVGSPGGTYCIAGTDSTGLIGAGGGGAGAAGGTASGTGGSGGSGGISGFDPANLGVFSSSTAYTGTVGGSGGSVASSSNDTRSGGGGGAGGFGAILLGTQAFASSANITGGNGGTGGYARAGVYGNGSGGAGGDGGIGVFIGGGASFVQQDFSIRGGTGGTGGYGFTIGGKGGGGGDGVFIANGTTFSTSGVAVRGGDGGVSGTAYSGVLSRGGAGGRGVYQFLAGNVTTVGGGGESQYSITGGTGGAGADGATAVEFRQGGSLSNSSGFYISGGTGGSGIGSYASGNGGAGVKFGATGTVTNTAAIITGGYGGASNYSTVVAGIGGAGISMLAGGTINNLSQGGSNAKILGGYGGTGYQSLGSTDIFGGAGGVGILGSGLLVNNTGTQALIAGGDGGGIVSNFARQNGGAGGAGISGSNSTIINSGTIRGGAGGPTSKIISLYRAPGGTGITGADLSIVNSGTISGGTAGFAYGENGVVLTNAPLPPAAKAIVFTGGVNSLELQAGSLITGDVVAYSAKDTLSLGGSVNSTFDVSSVAAAGASDKQYQNFGIFIKKDASTFTLSGTTPAVTDWTILGGTLAISSDGNLGAPSGRLTINGGTLQTTATIQSARSVILGSSGGAINTDSGTALTLTGSLTGSGSLSKLGAGTLQLAGTASHTGGTLVNAGTLQAGAANAFSPLSALSISSVAVVDLAGFNQSVASLAGSGTVKLGAGTLSTGADNSTTTFFGLISGSGGLTKTGLGTMTLSGSSTYTGITSINAGGLQAGAVNAFSSGSAFVVAQGTRLDTGGFNQNIGSLAGAGSVFLGTGRLTTGGNNSSTQFSGVLSGIGSLAKAGTGTLTLSGVNTYTGGTLVKSGTLAVTNGSAVGSGVLGLSTGTTLAFVGSNFTFSNPINFVDPTFGDPAFDTGTGTITLASIISGQDSLSKLGAGTLILTAANAYTGNTFVSFGTLQVDGSIATSPLAQVASGATLSGIGSIGGISAAAGSIVSPGNPGNPYGTLRATGAVTFVPGSTFSVSVSPAIASQLSVTGTAALAGNLSVAFAPGPYDPTRQYSVLTATRGISGTFGTNIFSAIPGYTPLVIYSPNSVNIGFSQVLTQAQANASVQTLAGDRMGQMITNRTLVMILGGFNEQINCNSCVSAFGSIGSFSAGVHGRKLLTEDLSLIGGVAYANYSSGGAEVVSAPMLAAALRYDVTEFGSSRPFAEVGVFATPSQRVHYKRGYSNGTTGFSGSGSVTGSTYSTFAKLGWVWRLTPVDEVAANVELARIWQHAGGYAETFNPGNPAPASFSGGSDRVNIAKIGGQWTHLFGGNIETQLNFGIVQTFGSHSGLTANVAGNGIFTGSFRERTFAEYGLRVGYRIQKGVIVDAFADGTLGPKPVGNTVHVGLAVRYTF